LVPLVFLILPGGVSGQVAARDSMRWYYTAKLTAVWAAGNSESSTFGVGSTLRNLRQRSELRFDLGALRTDAGVRTRRAIGTTASFRVEDTTEREKTAESYFLRNRYDRKLSDRFVLFLGFDWQRNTFAGIDSRTLIAAGAGNVWASSDAFRFKTDYSLTYTFQQDVVENPFIKSKFPGVRFSWDLLRTLTSTTKLESVLIADLNVDNTDDLRADFTNGLSVSISSAVALKPSLQILWRNDPALTEIDLVTTAGTPTGMTVVAPLEKMDSFFTMALVITI
jgi:hypothetical protein